MRIGAITVSMLLGTALFGFSVACTSPSHSPEANDQSDDSMRSIHPLLAMRFEYTWLDVYEYNEWWMNDIFDCRAAHGTVRNEELDMVRAHVANPALEPLFIDLAEDCPLPDSFTVYFENYQRKACWTGESDNPAVNALNDFYGAKRRILSDAPRYECAAFDEDDASSSDAARSSS